MFIDLDKVLIGIIIDSGKILYYWLCEDILVVPVLFILDDSQK